MDNLVGSPAPELRKLNDYVKLCDGNPSNRSMIFTDMPNSDENAREKAKQMATTLKEFDRLKVAPLVIMEPETTWGTIDFKEFSGGFYDAWIDAYFKYLKAEGVTDKQMGMWVPFPEANLPYWNHANSKPEDFSINVTKVISMQKRHFPASKASIMLNSATYETDDFDWRRGEYLSLVPYLRGIPPGLIDSFGYQGLPWMPAAGAGGSGVVDTNEYLDHKIAKEAADTLGVKSIWFNTGTFGRKYTLDPEKAIIMPPEQRKDILAGVIVQAKKLRDQGYSVSVNLFAQDKSQVAEATDWSYWTKDSLNTPDAVVFADFASTLKKESVELWLFDR